MHTFLSGFRLQKPQADLVEVCSQARGPAQQGTGPPCKISPSRPTSPGQGTGLLATN